MTVTEHTMYLFSVRLITNLPCEAKLLPRHWYQIKNRSVCALQFPPDGDKSIQPHSQLQNHVVQPQRREALPDAVKACGHRFSGTVSETSPNRFLWNEGKNHFCPGVQMTQSAQHFQHLDFHLHIHISDNTSFVNLETTGASSKYAIKTCPSTQKKRTTLNVVPIVS